MTRRGRLTATVFCALAFAVGVYAEPLGLVGWWLK